MTTKTKTTTTKTRLGLYITEKHDDRFYHVYAHVVTIGTNAYERQRIDRGAATDVPYDRIRNASDEAYAGLYLENLHVDSQGNDDDQTRHLYGFEVRYRDVYTVDQWKAKRMYDTLRTIGTRLEKLDAKYGSAATFGAYLARVAEAIGADAFVFPAGRQRGWSYSENEQRIEDIRQGIYAVDGMVRAWTTPRLETTEQTA